MTRNCADIQLYAANLTSSYISQSNEASIGAGSVMMFLLAGIFFNLNLFSGISDVSAILNPKVRLVLSSALSLLLPVMSYLFSEAKNARMVQYGSTTGTPDLSLQAGIILVWMLLVELLRKKVDAIRMPGFSGTLQRAGRVVWLGSLVFLNVHSPGRKIVYGILWIFCATTLVQRVAFHEFEKRSYAHGKNAMVIASYMAHILGHHATTPATTTHDVRGDDDVEHAAQGGGGPELLKKCRYIVAGEVHLVKEAVADGYAVDEISTGVVTVGDVWKLPENDSCFASSDGDLSLRRLCLSFALFKLLRRRFQQREPLSEEEAGNGRELIFKGLYHHKEDQRTAAAEAVF